MIGRVLRGAARTDPKGALGSLLRLPLGLLPRGAVLPIPSGELRGMRWEVGAGTFGCLLGTYEHDKQRLFASAVRPGMVVWDVGANVGFYTLLAARLVGPAGAVRAFEPVPRNAGAIRRHVETNRLTNVAVHQTAVGAQVGRAAFQIAPAAEMGRLVQNGAESPDERHLSVPVTTIDQLLADGEAPPDLVKIDVEGAEVDVLDGARGCLERHAPRLFVAIHTHEARRRCLEMLEGLAYAVSPIDGRPLERSLELDARPPDATR